MLEKSHKFILLGSGLIFLILYLTQMNNALWHDELIATSFFHQFTPFSLSPEGYLDNSMLDFSRNWRSYFRIYPPGFVTFYYFVAKITGDNEIAMRIPLLILCSFVLFKFYGLFKSFFSKREAAIYTLLISLSPIWYGQGIRLNPESYSLCFSALSFVFLYEYISTNKKKTYNFLLLVNALWMLFDYLSMFICILQYTSLFCYRKKGEYKNFLLIILALLLLYLFLLALTTGVQEPNPFMFKWARPEMRGLLKILQFFSIGRIND